jgi:integrase/recombinase XerD
MPRKPRNLYLRGDTWWGRVKIAGTLYRSSLRTADPREAARRLKGWRQQLEREHFGAADAPTFKEAVVKWAAEVLPKAVKPSVAARYMSSIAQLDGTFAELRMDQITSQTVAAYISARSGKATNATIRRDLTALSRLLAACIAWGWRTDNPAATFDRSIIRERRDPIQPPDPASMALVLAEAPPLMVRILQLLDQTGMRENEAVQLEAADISRPRRQILLLKTKTNRPRTLDWKTPGGDAGPVLAELPQAGWLFPVGEGKKAVPYANFSSNVGQVMRRLAAREKAAGRPFRRFRVHDLRHGFAVRWLKAGGNIYDLSRHLGHTSVKTTEVYLGFLTAAERAVAQMGAQQHYVATREPEGEGVLTD